MLEIGILKQGIKFVKFFLGFGEKKIVELLAAGLPLTDDLDDIDVGRPAFGVDVELKSCVAPWLVLGGG